jgi:hypothetical protein
VGLQGIDSVVAVRPAISEKRIRANRANSVQSTGPKTDTGKRRAARNATRHGLLTREIVCVHLGESEKEFGQLLNDLCDEYRPVGPTEQMLVEKIAACWWRLVRVRRAERGALVKEVNAVYDRSRQMRDQFTSDLFRWTLMRVEVVCGTFDQRVALVERAMRNEEVIRNLGRTPEGIDFLVTVVRTIREEIDEKGSLSIEHRDLLCDCLGRQWLTSMPPTDASNRAIFDETEKNELLAMLDGQISSLESLRHQTAIRKKGESQAAAGRINLPSTEESEKLIRYETHLDRMLYRAMDQLERHQRRRLGEIVLPPLNVNLTNQR